MWTETGYADRVTGAGNQGGRYLPPPPTIFPSSQRQGDFMRLGGGGCEGIEMLRLSVT